MRKPQVYYLQNNAIQAAREQLERSGVLDPLAGLNQIRNLAADLNSGKASISSLSLTQRETLIDQLIGMGAQVRNPHIYGSDLKAEAGGSPVKKEPRNILVFSRVREDQLRMLDTLATKVAWRAPDGYKRLCWKLLRSPRPRNSREVTKLRLALESIALQNRP